MPTPAVAVLGAGVSGLSAALALARAGADDIDLRPKLRGAHRPEDEELAILGVRRPLIEWALRRAALREPGVQLSSGVRVLGLEGSHDPVPRVTGVESLERR